MPPTFRPRRIIGNAVLNTSQLDPTWPCPLQLHHCSTLGARRCAPSAACPNRSRDERRNPARGQGRVIHHQRPGKRFDIAAFRVMSFRGRTPQVNHLGHASAHRTGSNERSRTRHAQSCAARVQKVSQGVDVLANASIDRGWLGPQRITRSVSLEDARSGHSACADLVRSHPLCPLSYGRAFHAPTERKTRRRIVAQRLDSGMCCHRQPGRRRYSWAPPLRPTLHQLAGATVVVRRCDTS
jgi:hypothetical protein